VIGARFRGLRAQSFSGIARVPETALRFGKRDLRRRLVLVELGDRIARLGLPRIEAVRIVDMSASNSWAEFAGVFSSTRQAFLEHERAKVELKGLIPEDAKEAFGHGIRARRSKSGAISFDLVETEAAHAPLQ